MASERKSTPDTHASQQLGKRLYTSALMSKELEVWFGVLNAGPELHAAGEYLSKMET